ILDSSDKKEQLDFGEDWFTGIGAFGEQVAQKASAATAEVLNFHHISWLID
ncbi:hypothetical protein AG4045_011321, partial [Apium graveolens]